MKNKIKIIPRKAYKFTEDIAYLLGAIIGDAYLNDRFIRLQVIDLDFLKEVKNKLQIITNSSIRIVKDNHDWGVNDQYRIVFWSVKLCKIFQNYRHNLRKIMSKSRKSIKSNFLNGFLDAEGCVGKSNISITNNNYEYISVCCQILKDFKIEYYVTKRTYRKKRYKDTFYLIVSRKYNIIRFRKFFKFSIKRKQERLNSFKPHYNDSQIGLLTR